MGAMRRMVAQLEAQKRALLALATEAEPLGEPLTEDDDPVTSDAGGSSSPSPTTTRTPLSPVDADAKLQRGEFVRLAADVEALRKENAALVASIRQRDMFASALQNLMLEFDHPPELAELLEEAAAMAHADVNEEAAQGDGSNSSKEVAFTPLTADEAADCARSTIAAMDRARSAHARDATFAKGAQFFGWSEFTFRKNATISFAVKKTLPNTSPANLLATTWRFVTDARSTKRLIRPQLSATYTPLQILSKDMIVIDRRTDDPCRVGVDGKPLAMRTVYLLFWTRVPSEYGDAYVLAMKTIDLPLVKRLLRDDELWCDIFYWIRFAPDGSVDASGGRPTATVAEFGGVNTYLREEIASSWLAELVFLAIRWETLAVAPCLLTN